MSQPLVVSIIRRSLIYLGLALAGLALIAFMVVISIRTGIEFSGGWIGFVGYTALLFWLTIRQSRSYWTRISFWPTITGLLLVHSLAFIAILRAYPQWRMIWFAPTVIVEAGLFAAILHVLFDKPEHR